MACWPPSVFGTWPLHLPLIPLLLFTSPHSFPSFYTLPSISFLQLFFRFLQVIYLKVDEWGVLGSRAVEVRWCFFRDQFWTPLFSGFGTNLGSILGPILAQNPSRRNTFPTPFSIPFFISFWSSLDSPFGCFLAPFLDLICIMSVNVPKP